MASIVLDSGILVEDYKEPYIIAEVNSSHGGDLNEAREMIKIAKEVGANCVKFQSFSVESLYSKSYYEKNKIQKRIVEKFSLNAKSLLEMAHYAREIGIDFSSTPYAENEVDSLCDMQVPFIKIASMEINNLPFLRYIARKQKPMILSTGMAELSEIQRAVSAIESAGNSKIIILHCNSTYPTKIENINLNNIFKLREIFTQYPIGFSDHTLDDSAAIVATALGAAVIEKHFTLDKSKVGMDNNMAMQPLEFESMVRKCKDAFRALGSKERILSKEELAQRVKMRRSVVAKIDLKKGTRLNLEMLSAKRPGEGIPPCDMESLVGKVLKVDKGADCVIMPDEVENLNV